MVTITIPPNITDTNPPAPNPPIQNTDSNAPPPPPPPPPARDAPAPNPQIQNTDSSAPTPTQLTVEEMYDRASLLLSQIVVALAACIASNLVIAGFAIRNPAPEGMCYLKYLPITYICILGVVFGYIMWLQTINYRQAVVEANLRFNSTRQADEAATGETRGVQAWSKTWATVVASIPLGICALNLSVLGLLKCHN